MHEFSFAVQAVDDDPPQRQAHGCKVCQVVWFARGARPTPLPVPKQQEALPPDVQRQLAEAYVKADNQRQRRQDMADKLRDAPLNFFKSMFMP